MLHRLDSRELAASLTGRADDVHARQWQAEVEQTQVQPDDLAELWGEKAISRSEWLFGARAD